jgi:hypothetical protein
MTTQPRLGIGIGKVIINGPGHPGGGDTAFFQGDETVMLATPEMEGAFDAIRRLNAPFAGRVWLVSKCGARVQERTRRWLDAHSFHQRTGVARDHVRSASPGRKSADLRGNDVGRRRTWLRSGCRALTCDCVS